MQCVVCGKEIDKPSYIGGVCSHSCLIKQYWQEVLDDSAIIINGECYHIGKKNTNFRGFGGKKYTILFNDGIKITTTNLWHNGKIPEEFLVPDNAKFISK